MINNSSLTGRLTKDPEIRYTKDGIAVVEFTLAVSRFYKRDETDFIRCVGMNKTAELIAQYLKKGSLIGVEGRIQTRTFEGQDGKTVYITEIFVNQCHFLESKPKPETPPEAPPNTYNGNMDSYRH